MMPAAPTSDAISEVCHVRTAAGDRLRRAVVALCSVACAVATASCSSAGAGGDPVASRSPQPAEDDGGTYLALGDSVPFGYRGGLSAEYSDQGNFTGYPELVGEELGLDVINASCPGETAASFVDTAAQSYGCQHAVGAPLGYRMAFPLHVAYESPSQSQLEFAVRTLTEDDDVELVTVQIGANDGFLCLHTAPGGCATPSEVESLQQDLRAGLDTILSTLRDEGGYDGRIVVVTYYSLGAGSGGPDLSALLNEPISQAADAHDADLADGFDAFREALGADADPVAAGLVLPDDVHPSDEGQRVLADAVVDVVEG
jgi:lysophospholipase L1-like esterase